MASTHRNLLNRYVLCQLSGKGILEPKGNEQQPSCFLLAARQALRLCSHPQRLRAEPGRCGLAENKSHFPHHGHRDPAEMLKFTWTPGGCRQRGCKHPDATLPVGPSTLGSGWQSCHDKLSILTAKRPHSQGPISSSQKATLAVSERLPEQHEAKPWQRWRCNSPMLLTPASERAV